MVLPDACRVSPSESAAGRQEDVPWVGGHTIIRRTIHQYYINQAVKQGHPRQQVQAGSITFLQRFGSRLNLNLHYPFIFLAGVYLDRSAQGLKPKFVKLAPPSDADIAAVVTQIGQRGSAS
jgi:hypothetical protein